MTALVPGKGGYARGAQEALQPADIASALSIARLQLKKRVGRGAGRDVRRRRRSGCIMVGNVERQVVRPSGEHCCLRRAIARKALPAQKSAEMQEIRTSRAGWEWSDAKTTVCIPASKGLEPHAGLKAQNMSHNGALSSLGSTTLTCSASPTAHLISSYRMQVGHQSCRVGVRTGRAVASAILGAVIS